MTNQPTTIKPKMATKSLLGMTDEMVIAELRSNSLWNKARLKFSGASARIENSQQQRTPLSPIAMRRMEFEAVKEILSVYGFKHE